MSIWRCELTDRKSVVTRIWMRVLGCSAGFLLSLVMYQWPQPQLRLWLVAGPLLIVYMAVIGYALDSWKLQHPGEPRRYARLLWSCMVPLFVFMGVYVIWNLL